MNKHLNKLYFVTFLAVATVLFFQNCGKLDIKSPETVLASNFKTGQGYLCIEQGYTLDTFFITNMNIKYTTQGLLKDTDGDGLADSEETTIGYDPFKRRSASTVLDSICNDLNYGVDCSKFTQSCNTDHNEFGLNECDIAALNLEQSIQVGAGIDSDKDSVPDYLEIRIQSFPNLFDAYNDLDLDKVNTIGEGELGSSTRHSNNNVDPKNLIKISKTKLQNTPECSNGEYWQINILNLPVLSVEGYSDTFVGKSNFSHQANQNVLLNFLKIKPINNAGANAKIFSATQLVDYDPDNIDTKFSFDQNLLMPAGEVEQ